MRVAKFNGWYGGNHSCSITIHPYRYKTLTLKKYYVILTTILPTVFGRKNSYIAKKRNKERTLYNF